MKQESIKSFLETEFLSDIHELETVGDVEKKLKLLVDNNKGILMNGFCPTHYISFNKFRFLSYKMVKWNKDLKKHLVDDLTDLPEKYKDFDMNKYDVHPEMDKYRKVLSKGVYYAMPKGSKKELYCVLVVKDDDEEYPSFGYSMYIIGDGYQKFHKKLVTEFHELQKVMNPNDKNKVINIETGEMKTVVFKSFDEMVFTDKEKYISYIDNWKKNIPNYYKYNIIPKLSILLYGEPGTGKSTFCRALAKSLDIKKIKNIPPDYFYHNMNTESSRLKKNNKIESTDDADAVLLCIDDIDCVGRSRDNDTSLDNARITSSLLEFLDNPPTCYMKADDNKYYPVSIICATTNYYDRLDSATKRHGRFDLTIEMKQFTEKQANELCHVYGLKLKDVYKDKITEKTKFNPAQIQALCMENIDKTLKNEDHVEE